MKIAVDVMGTDYGPKELVLGAVNAVKEYGCETVLVGDEKIIRELLVIYGAVKNPKITIHHASEVIAMDEHPAIAVKSKMDASILVAAGLLRTNECDALVSSGSTGAAVASALFCGGRLEKQYSKVHDVQGKECAGNGKIEKTVRDQLVVPCRRLTR